VISFFKIENVGVDTLIETFDKLVGVIRANYPALVGAPVIHVFSSGVLYHYPFS